MNLRSASRRIAFLRIRGVAPPPSLSPSKSASSSWLVAMDVTPAHASAAQLARPKLPQ